jgi:hypothetical protein
LEEIIFEIFNICKNNIISVELATPDTFCQVSWPLLCAIQLISITVKPWPLPRPENTKEKYQAGLYFGTVVEKFGEACGVVIFVRLFNVW